MKQTKCLILLILFSGFVILGELKFVAEALLVINLLFRCYAGTIWYFEVTQSRGKLINNPSSSFVNPLIGYCNIPTDDSLDGREGIQHHHVESCGCFYSLVFYRTPES